MINYKKGGREHQAKCHQLQLVLSYYPIPFAFFVFGGVFSAWVSPRDGATWHWDMRTRPTSSASAGLPREAQKPQYCLLNISWSGVHDSVCCAVRRVPKAQVPETLLVGDGGTGSVRPASRPGAASLSGAARRCPHVDGVSPRSDAPLMRLRSELVKQSAHVACLIRVSQALASG